MLIRPGSKTANAIIARQQMKGGGPPIRRDEWWVQRVRYTDFSDADTSQVLTLNSLFPENAFPTEAIILDCAYFDLVEAFVASGLTDFDLILGTSASPNDTNGLIEATAVETGQSLGRKATSGTFYAAANRRQAAMSPLLQGDSVGANLNTFTAGIVDIYIPYTLLPSSRPA